MTEHKIPQVGDAVKIVNETYEEHDALVVAVHGVGSEWQGKFMQPSINAVYVSGDESKRDPYGVQLERLSSCSHFDQTEGMPKRGRYWDFK